MSKKIITDCDGVLLDWCYAYDIWMSEQGYQRQPDTDHSFNQTVRYGISEEDMIDTIKSFNESGSVGYLPAFKDSVQYVTRLAEEGWRFDVVSSLHIDKYAQTLRKKNLTHLFGDVFDKIDASLSFTGGKGDYLAEHYGNTGYWWIEDSVSHAVSGQDAGLKSIIMDHPYNKRWEGLRVTSWKELYGVINDTTH